MMFRVRVYGEVLPKNRFCAIYRVDLKNNFEFVLYLETFGVWNRVFWWGFVKNNAGGSINHRGSNNSF